MNDPEPDRRVARAGPVAAVIAAITGVALYVWDDALFAGPIVAAAGLIGPFPAFVAFTVLYGVANFVLALLVVRAYDRRSGGSASRLEVWVESQATAPRGSFARKLVQSGKAMGFVLASFLLGGIVTTWLVRYAGGRDRIVVVAAASSAIFAVTFVGLYSGVTKLVIDR